MVPCVMCGKEFEKEQLDFLDRCEPCFKLFMMMPDKDKPKMHIPFSPIYNGDNK